MKTIIIDGANGYVASHFIQKLLQQKYRVVALVRPSANFSPRERMNEVLSEISDGGNTNTSNLKVYGYSLLHKDFMIPNEKLEEMFSEEVDYFHFAASLKFSLNSKEEIFEVNVGGVGNSIQVFSKFAKGNSRFFFIGTAYSCGKFPGLFEEKFYPNEEIENFRNYYEQSKRFAENVVKKHIDEDGLNGHVIRLSQVVGNSKTGITKTDYGIFDFAKRLHKMAFRLPGQTVRVHVDSDSTQNLISINTVVHYLMRTVGIKNVPTIMNFVAKKQVKNFFILKSISDLLPIRIIPKKKISRGEMNALERIIAAGMAFTEGYVDMDLQFDTKNLDKILVVEGHEVNENSVYKMLEYFIKNLGFQSKGKAMVLSIQMK